MRADFTTHDLVCGDHDGCLMSRLSVEVNVGGAIRWWISSSNSEALIAEWKARNLPHGDLLAAQVPPSRPSYYVKGVQGTMSNNNESNKAIQRRPKPSEVDPLPRVKLPTDLQKRVDDEERLLDQIYDGT